MLELVTTNTNTVKNKNPFADLFESNLNDLLFGKSLRDEVARTTVTENEVTIKIDIPGVKKEDVDIEIDKDILTVKAVRKDLQKEEKIIKSWTVSAFFDKLNITSKLEDGVLTVILPKTEQAKREKIKIPVL